MNELFSLLRPVSSDGVVSKRAATDVNVSRLPTYKFRINTNVRLRNGVGTYRISFGWNLRHGAFVSAICEVRNFNKLNKR